MLTRQSGREVQVITNFYNCLCSGEFYNVQRIYLMHSHILQVFKSSKPVKHNRPSSFYDTGDKLCTREDLTVKRRFVLGFFPPL